MPSWSRSSPRQREDKKTGKFVQTLGSRKLWIRLRGQGHDVARCTVERIMREQGWEGARYGSKHKTTIADDTHRAVPGSGGPQFLRCRRQIGLWVADFTYVSTWMRVRLRRVRHRCLQSPDRGLAGRQVDDHRAGPRRRSSMPSSPAPRKAPPTCTGLIAHNDAGAQYTSVAFTQRLIDEGVDPSVGSVGDALDNALAETTVGSFKNELIRRQGPWRDVNHVEIATAEWVALVQHRAPARVPRRLHPRGRRETPLRSQTHPTKSGVTQRQPVSGLTGTAHILATVKALTDRGVTLVSTSDGIDSSTAAGRMMIGVLGSLAEYERELVKERTALKRQASRTNGARFGRPKSVNDPVHMATAKRMKADGHTARDIAKFLGVSRATLYRYLAAENAA